MNGRTDDSLYRRSEQALSAEVGDDVVALHIAKGHCYGMEKVAAEVWNLLEQPASIEQLCAGLVERYEVEPERCRSEVVDLLRQFEQEGLVERA
jgi:hypothetical protein